MASYLRSSNTVREYIFNEKEKANLVKYAWIFAYIAIEIANIISYIFIIRRRLMRQI